MTSLRERPFLIDNDRRQRPSTDGGTPQQFEFDHSRARFPAPLQFAPVSDLHSIAFDIAVASPSQSQNQSNNNLYSKISALPIDLPIDENDDDSLSKNAAGQEAKKKTTTK